MENYNDFEERFEKEVFDFEREKEKIKESMKHFNFNINSRTQNFRMYCETVPKFTSQLVTQITSKNTDAIRLNNIIIRDGEFAIIVKYKENGDDKQRFVILHTNSYRKGEINTTIAIAPCDMAHQKPINEVDQFIDKVRSLNCQKQNERKREDYQIDISYGKNMKDANDELSVSEKDAKKIDFYINRALDNIMSMPNTEDGCVSENQRNDPYFEAFLTDEAPMYFVGESEDKNKRIIVVATRNEYHRADDKKTIRLHVMYGEVYN